MINSFKSIKRMRMMAFLIMLQLSIGLTMLNSTTAVIEFNQNRVKNFSRLFNFEKTYLVRLVDTQGIGTTQRMVSRYNRIYQLMDEFKELEKKGGINSYKIYFPLYILPERIKSNVSKDYINDKMMEYSCGLLVNDRFYNDYNLKISEGRGFTKEDFERDYTKETIPIILGSDFKNKIKIGDVIPYEAAINKFEIIPDKFNDKGEPLEQVVIVPIKYEVIAFYDNLAIPAMTSSIKFIQSIKYSNSLTIVPTTKGVRDLDGSGQVHDIGAFLEFDDESKMEALKSKLNNDLKDDGYYIETTALNNDYKSIKESLFKDVINSVALGGVLTILSVIGITSVLLGELNERRKEFGIRISSGATLTTICKELIGEIFIMVSIASVISFVGLAIKGIFLKTDSLINLNVILVNIAIVFIITFIISLMPILKIRKINIVDLMRGE